MGEGSCADRERAPPADGIYRPRNPRASPLWQCATRHAPELRKAGRLCRAVEQQVIERFIRCGDPHHGFARIHCDPGMILFVQTFGDLANFNPHVHVLAADGAFLPDGRFVPLLSVAEPLSGHAGGDHTGR